MSKRHQHIEDLLSLIDKAEGTFDLPWRKGNTRPVNLSSGRPYRGINTLTLMVSQMVHSFENSVWLTFKQALALGGCIRKGEKGSKIIFYKTIPEEQRKPDSNGFVIRFSTAFNISQIDGIDLPAIEDKPGTIEAYAQARGFCDNIPIPVEYGGDMACYIPSHDKVLMPEESTFFDTDSGTASQHFLSTLLHEFAHGTGHKSRLDRFNKPRDLPTIAYEELIAEIAASLLSIDLGIETTICDDHAKYLASWKKIIKDEPNVLLRAASAAEKAIDVLQSYQVPIMVAAE